MIESKSILGGTDHLFGEETSHARSNGTFSPASRCAQLATSSPRRLHSEQVGGSDIEEGRVDASSATSPLPRLLSDSFPAARRHRFLRLLVALVFGTGTHWRGVYAVNILLLLVLLLGQAFEVHVFVASYADEEIRKQLKKGGQSDSATDLEMVLVLGSILLAGLALFASFIQASVCVHRSSSNSSVCDLLAGDSSTGCAVPAERLRLTKCRKDWVDGGRTHSRCNAKRSWSLYTQLKSVLAANLPVVICTMGLALAAMELVVLLITMSDTRSLQEHSSQLPWTESCLTLGAQCVGLALTRVWGVASLGTFLAVFYALVEDLTLVCTHVGECVLKLLRQRPEKEKQEDLDSGRMRPSYIEAVELLQCLQNYMDSTLGPFKVWFVCVILGRVGIMCTHIALCVGRLLGKFKYSSTAVTLEDLLIFLATMFFYLVPLLSATRATSCWNALVKDIVKDTEFHYQHPRDYQSLSTFLSHYRGGFFICGYRLENGLLLQIFPIAFTVAGLARYF